MTWVDWHRQSEAFADEAAAAFTAGRTADALRLYGEAARHEERALGEVGSDKPRTLGVVAISATSLWYKANAWGEVERLAFATLQRDGLPEFAASELRLLVQFVWSQRAKAQAGIAFLPGEVTVSVSGGDVVVGGAPLDLIVDKVQTIQSMFYRTIEHARGMSFRTRGAAPPSIQEACKPWLFQAPPGSYQFTVAIRRPAQIDFFEDGFRPEEIADRFLRIVRAAGDGNEAALAEVVPEPQYRSAFLKLSRNLAPTGKTYSRLEMRIAGDSPVTLSPESRVSIAQMLRGDAGTMAVPSQPEQSLEGVLRAVHLDKDWLVIMVDGEPKRVWSVQQTVDDLIGPMINRVVRVRTFRRGRKLHFVDIELDE